MEKYGPIALIVLSNVFYHICSKATPTEVNPFAALTVTYGGGAVMSGVLYYVLNPGGNLLQQYHLINWSTLVLGLAIVGLEAGSIYMYKAGWDIGTGQLVYSAILTVLLLLIGALFYRESITANKVVGILICMAGLYLINR